MNEDGTGRQSILFRVHNGGIYSIPIQYVTRVEALTGKFTTVPHSPDYIAGVYQQHRKNISVVDLAQLLGLRHKVSNPSISQNLLVIENTGIGLLVETVLGVAILRLRQIPGPMSSQLVQNVCSYNDKDELVFELDVPKLLSLCRYSPMV